MIEHPENINDITMEMVQQTREYCQRFIAPIATEIDQKNLIDREVWNSMGQMGFLGVSIDQLSGGGGMGYIEHCLLIEELAKASPGVALSYLNHTSSCIDLIKVYGNEAQKRAFLPKLLSGKFIGTSALYESTGSPLNPEIQCSAELKNGCLVLNGKKVWVVNGIDADIFIIFAHTDNPKYRDSLSAIIVTGDNRGLVRGPRLQTRGMRGSGICNISLKNCSVPLEHTLGNMNGARDMLVESNIRESVTYAAAPLGVAQAVLDLIVMRCQERLETKSIEAVQGIEQIADIYARHRSHRAFIHKLAVDLQDNKISHYEAQSGLYLAAQLAVETVQIASDLNGIEYYLFDDVLARLARDVNFYTVGMYSKIERQNAIGNGLLQINDRPSDAYSHVVNTDELSN